MTASLIMLQWVWKASELPVLSTARDHIKFCKHLRINCKIDILSLINLGNTLNWHVFKLSIYDGKCKVGNVSGSVLLLVGAWLSSYPLLSASRWQSKALCPLLLPHSLRKVPITTCLSVSNYACERGASIICEQRAKTVGILIKSAWVSC